MVCRTSRRREVIEELNRIEKLILDRPHNDPHIKVLVRRTEELEKELCEIECKEREYINNYKQKRKRETKYII